MYTNFYRLTGHRKPGRGRLRHGRQDRSSEDHLFEISRATVDEIEFHRKILKCCWFYRACPVQLRHLTASADCCYSHAREEIVW
jgi:hypothetical protein